MRVPPDRGMNPTRGKGFSHHPSLVLAGCPRRSASIPKMNYKVEIDQTGRGGSVSYTEDGQTLSLDWEFAVGGVDIFVPTPEEWDAYWQNRGAIWAAGRRQEILERVAEEAR